MAEYMEKEDIKKNCNCTYNGDCWGNCNTCSDKALFITDVDDLPKADVVEREKYDELRSLYDEAYKDAISFGNAWLKEREKYKQLKQKIDKIDNAIKEMERYSTAFEHANKHDLASAVDYCIWVIQENIGE